MGTARSSWTKRPGKDDRGSLLGGWRQHAAAV
jgi:hypothetical protein